MNFIALQMLFGDRGKYVAMIIGITFAALIMTQQPAIFLGLMTHTYGFVKQFTLPDIWVMDPTVEYVEESKPLRDTELQRVRGIDGVEWAVPLFKGLQTVLLPDGRNKSIDITGLDDATLIGAPRIMEEGSIEDLRIEDGIIIDSEASQVRYALNFPDGTRRPMRVGDVMEINDRRAVVVGIAKMARTFTTLPQAVTTYSRALQYWPSQRRVLSYILVKAKDGVNHEELAKHIRATTGLQAWPRKVFEQVNMQYWMENTGIPINFGISVFLGFLVGAAIAGQSFFNFIRESLKQFAALKAMGVASWTLVKMVLLQALVVGIIGWGIGIGASALFGWSMRDSVLAFYMPWQILAFSFAGVAMIISCAALFGIRAVIKLDPSDVFRA